MRKMILIPALALLAGAMSFAAEKVTVAELLKSPEKYDGKIVTVTGKAVKFQQKTSKAGNDYFTMKLVGKNDDERISVYGRGKQKEIKDDETIEVTGKFAKEKKVGSATFKFEVDVTKDKEDDKTKNNGIKPVKN
jgi:lipocalin